jgi:nitroreductase
MTIAAIIRERRTIGSFSDRPVSPDQIVSLLETAVWAPNHRMTEPWRFVIVTAQGVIRYAEIRAAMAQDASRSADEADRQRAYDGTLAKFAAIPAYLLVIQKQVADDEIRMEDYAACSALIQNFMLLAWEAGLGTAWKTFKDDPRLRSMFALAGDERVVGIVHVGYANESPQSQRSPLESRISMISS